MEFRYGNGIRRHRKIWFLRSLYHFGYFENIYFSFTSFENKKDILQQKRFSRFHFVVSFFFLYIIFLRRWIVKKYNLRLFSEQIFFIPSKHVFGGNFKQNLRNKFHYNVCKNFEYPYSNNIEHGTVLIFFFWSSGGEGNFTSKSFKSIKSQPTFFLAPYKKGKKYLFRVRDHLPRYGNSFWR